MALRKTKKSTTTTGTNATIDQYFKVKTPTPIATRNVDENFNSQPIEDDMKPLLSPERKIEKISKQIKRKPLAEISEPCTTTFSMAIPKKPSKPAFVVLRDEDIDRGVTEAQQPTTDTHKDKTTVTTQPDSLWTQSIPIGNTYNSQSSITSSPVNVFTQEPLLPHLQKLDKDNNNSNIDDSDDSDNSDNGIGLRIDELDDDLDDDDDNVDPFFDDLDDPFIKKTNKRRIPYSTTFSNKRQCPFSVTSGLNKTNSSSKRIIRNKSIFNENDDEEEEEDDDDDLFPADSLLFTSDNNSSKSDSITTNSTRIDSTTTDDQEKLDNHSISPLIKDSIGSPKEITSSPIIEYSISESMTFPIEYHDEDEEEDENGDGNNNDNDLQEKDNSNDTLVDNSNNSNNNDKFVNENDGEKENKKNNVNPTSSPPILKEKIRSTVSSPTKSTILSPISKSPLRSTLSSPTKSPFKSLLSSPSKSPLSSTSINTSQLATLPISLPSDSSLDVHIAYPNPRGKSFLEKFDISDN